MIKRWNKENLSTMTLVDFLGELLSELSEQCYYAAWFGGTEYIVPELARRSVELSAVQYWGHGFLNPSLGSTLLLISEELGSWVDYSDSDGRDEFKPFHPFPIPAEYRAALDRERDTTTSRATRHGSRPRSLGPVLPPHTMQLFLKTHFGARYLANVDLHQR